MPTSGIGLPVLYYRKGTSGAFTAATCSWTSGSSYDCLLDYTPLGGVVAGGGLAMALSALIGHFVGVVL